MKLISENEQEDKVVTRLAALLCDLGVPTDCYAQEDAIAVTFVSSRDLDLEANTHRYMTHEERRDFLLSIENELKAAMQQACLQSAFDALSQAQGGCAHLNLRKWS